VFDDSAVLDFEPAGASDAHSRSTAAIRLFRAISRSFPRPQASADVGNSHAHPITIRAAPKPAASPRRQRHLIGASSLGALRGFGPDRRWSGRERWRYRNYLP
jgi:hypothetical protein